MKIFKILFIFGFVLNFQAQTKVASIQNDFGSLKQAFNIVDDYTGNFAIFLEESDKVYGILYDKNFNELGRVTAPDLSSKFKSILGYQVHGKKISLLLNTLNGRSYGVYHFNFETGEGNSVELDFKVRKEKFIEAVTYNNTIFVLTVPLFSSQLNIYEFKDIQSPIVHELILKENDLLDRRERPIRLYDLVEKAQLSYMDYEIPNSLEATSSEFKTYQEGENITMTSDKYDEFTQILTFNLETLSYDIKRITKPILEGSYINTKTNSFLHRDKLFQIGLNSKNLKFQIVDISTKGIIESYVVNENEDLFFKNSPIILEGGDFQRYRELDRTKQFFRKIREGDIGISVVKDQGLYQVTMGGISEQTNGAIFLGGYLGGIAGAMIVISINQMTNSYYGYYYTKSVRITGLFDEGFNSVEGEVPTNIFDKMNTSNTLDLFNGNTHVRTAYETVFKLDSFYVKGFYIKNAQTYYLVKYED